MSFSATSRSPERVSIGSRALGRGLTGFRGTCLAPFSQRPEGTIVTSVVWSEAAHTKIERRVMTAAYIAALATGAFIGWWTQWSVGAATAITLAWLVSRRCTHRYATLLPPVRGAGPDRDHARWYCDRCGRTWDAAFESATRPRVISTGYDEAKAVRAAARADALDKQRRRLSAKRSAARPRSTRPVPAPRTGPRPIAASPVEPRVVAYTEHDTARPFPSVRRVAK